MHHDSNSLLIAGERGTGAGQRSFVDGLEGYGLPREAGRR
jgi:hypothetical protein